MDILLVNKFLHPVGGAETSFLHTRDLLRRKGHRVIDFSMAHPDNVASEESMYFAKERSYAPGASPLRRVRDAAASVYSFEARRALARLLDDHRPDVAHLHSVYHQLTLGVVDELFERGIPVIQTLHDYKIACPAYTLFTEGAPCRRCVGSTPLHAVKHRCIKGSIPASALAAAEASLARRRGTYSRIQRFIAPSQFARSVAISAGVEPERVVYLPYFIPREEMVVPAGRDRDPILFFGGRLDETKGVRQLLRAFDRLSSGTTLRIAGWGPLGEVVAEAAARRPNIVFLGRLDRNEVRTELTRARAMVLPSIWEDNCPLIMLEARARATPVIVSDRGGPSEFVRDGVDGLIVDPADDEVLSSAMQRLVDDPTLAAAFGVRGYERLVRDHQEDSHYAELLTVYEDASNVLGHRAALPRPSSSLM
jgi:glycosyltransferase involved in cell wall biosynthesis